MAVLRKLSALGAQLAGTRRLAGSAPHLVPCSPPGQDLGSSGARVLEWMAQKAALRQDMFLLGAPGPELRRLALRFCELAGRECEYVALTRDTSEPELKQRREIVRGTMRYVDQPAVRAALHGRVLVLEGVEKAERNMLPLLNNLLENREMALEDGRFLLAPARYDALLAGGASAAELRARGLARVHEDFLVVALGLPVARFGGTPLDPPLRSRFQAATLRPLPLDERAALLARAAGGAGAEVGAGAALRRLADCADALRLLTALEPQAGGGGVPYLSEGALPPLARTLAALGPEGAPPAALLHRALPWSLISPSARAAVAGAVVQCGLAAAGAPPPTSTPLRLAAVEPCALPGGGGAAVRLRWAGGAAPALEAVPAGSRGPALGAWAPRPGELRLDAHEAALADLLQAHASGSDGCLVGPKGSGKTRVAQSFARALGLEVSTLHCYRDMSSRDLLQRRSTNETGDTVWEDSPLITAARNGWLAVLDGVHRLPPGLLAACLGRLAADRRVELPDGTALVSAPEWAALAARGHGEAALVAAGVGRVHPAFRLLATAEPPSAGSAWLSAELLPLFQFAHLQPTQPRDFLAALAAAGGGAQLAEEQRPALHRLGALTESLWLGLAHEPELRGALLSVRAMARLAAVVRAQPDALDGAVRRLLAPRLRAMPAGAREAVHALMGAAGVLPAETGDLEAAQPAGADGAQWVPAEGDVRLDAASELLVAYDAQNHLRIGPIRSAAPVPAATPRPELVPSVHFHTSARHLAALAAMLADDNAALPLLLLGDQGVGKNKLCDHFLRLLNREREYVQLHRDTTLGGLTQAPTLEDGVVRWADSALVRAATLGRTLVVDEADKAPLEVVCVLRALVEDGEVMLADGRVLSREGATSAPRAEGGRQLVPIHPDFRVLVLANRPGHPFLGNDLLRECGDVFATHVVHSPDAAGEAALLASVAPAAPAALLRRIAGLFAELRAQVGQGLLSYPYSTREAVAIARHLEAYPRDGLVGAAENVFSFDAHEPALAAQIAAVLLRHGVPVGALQRGPAVEAQAERVPLPPLEPAELWALGAAPAACALGREELGDVRTYGLAQPPHPPLSDAEPRPGRLETFCEARLRIPLPRRPGGKAAQVAALACSADGRIHALLHDLTLLSLDLRRGRRAELELGATFLHASAGAASGALVRPLPADCALARAGADGEQLDSAGEGADGGLLVFAPAAGLLLALTRAGRASAAEGGSAAERAPAADEGADFALVSSVRLPDALRPDAGSAAAGYASALFAGLGGARGAGGAGGRGAAPRVSAGAQQGTHWAAWLPPADGAERGGARAQRLCILDAGCSEALTVALQPPASSGAPAGPLRAVAALDGSGGAWLLEWAGGDCSVLALADSHGALAARGAVRAEQWPLVRSALGAQPGALPPPLALQAAALGPATGAAAAGGGAESVRLVGERGGALGAQAGSADAQLCAVLESRRLLGGLGGRLGSGGQALLLAVSPPQPHAPTASTPAAEAAALAAVEAADAAALGAAAPSPWRLGSGRLGALLSYLPASDSLVFAPADGCSALHVLSLREAAVYALRGAGVADAPPAAAAGEAARPPLLTPAVAAAPLPSAGGGPEGLVSAHADGSLVLWDLAPDALGAALREWRQIVGLPADGGEAAGGARGAGADALGGAAAAYKPSSNAAPTSAPKRGKESDGMQHVGGNTWAGGTGGRDTAGLGGRGGPYRLDGGHDIHQLSDELKAQVSPEALAAARQMAEAARAEHLSVIGMAPFEAEAYARIVGPVRREIGQLRTVLQGHEAREKARVWVGRQSSGELDEGRLVDGLAGESNVYRLRADAPPDSGGAPQLKPKVLRFVLDLSGSMYYFNRHDGRLDRQLQAAAMVLEALAGHEHRYRYAMVGHSGDGPCEPFVEYGAPPRNDKERLQLLQRMAAHTQYCQSGDSTLSAAREAVREVLTHDADERFVFVLSDANLARYRIEPADLRAALCSSEQVEGHALFISSLRDEAAQIRQALPAGRGHICLRASDVPRAFKEILHARALGNL